MEIITLEEGQLIFESVDLFKNFITRKYKFSDEEIEILLSSLKESVQETMLIDIIYSTFVKLEHTENKNDVENNLYKKIFDILNYYISVINFNDKKSKFIKEFEYALLHFEGPDFGIGNKRK